MAKKVVFLGMGGTIAGRAQSAGDNVGYRAGEVPVDALLQSVPGLSAMLAGTPTQVEQVAQIDSKDLEMADMARLASALIRHLSDPEIQAAVITHGTDTLEETAFFLSCVLSADLLARKAVILTCAMRPATALVPDGPGNLLDASAVALDPKACGVLVVAAGAIHAARHVQKVHPYRVDAFSSGEAGVLGFVEEGHVRWLQSPKTVTDSFTPTIALEALVAVSAVAEGAWPRVEIVLNHSGASGAVVHALCQAPGDGAPAVRGLVVAGTGNGTLHHALEAALHRAQLQGVRVVRVSRCPAGVVVAAGSGAPSGMLPTMPLSAVKARIALGLEILAEKR